MPGIIDPAPVRARPVWHSRNHSHGSVLSRCGRGEGSGWGRRRSEEAGARGGHPVTAALDALRLSCRWPGRWRGRRVVTVARLMTQAPSPGFSGVGDAAKAPVRGARGGRAGRVSRGRRGRLGEPAAGGRRGEARRTGAGVRRPPWGGTANRGGRQAAAVGRAGRAERRGGGTRRGGRGRHGEPGRASGGRRGEARPGVRRRPGNRAIDAVKACR